MGVPQKGWFIWENLIKMDDLGVPQFQETPIYEACGIIPFEQWCEERYPTLSHIYIR